MNSKYYFAILILFNPIFTQQPNNIISLFIDELPENNIKIPSNNNTLYDICKIFDPRHHCNGIEFPFYYGIFATYAGYLALSDLNGQMTFPRKTQKNSINLLVTNKISPVFMLKNTIAFWEINEPENAQMYKIERKQDSETKLHYWDVKEKELPKRIPIHTIIIFADPTSIYVPIGITPTINSSQLILPRIYAKKDFNHAKNSFFLLTIRPFFSKVKTLFKNLDNAKQIQVLP